MTDNRKIKPKQRRRWLRFSLRNFLIAFTLLGIGLGWFGREFTRLREQQRIVAKILKDGGKVAYDYQLDGGDMRQPPPAPLLLRRMFGDDLFCHVTFVQLGNTSIKNSDLEPLHHLRSLRYLTVFGSGVTDKGMAHLAKIRQLRGMNLSDANASPAGLKQVLSISTLEQISLYGAFISDAHLDQLKEFGDKLTSLQIIRAPSVTNDGLQCLGFLKEIEQVDLYDVKCVNNKTMEYLHGLKKLKGLRLLAPAVTDEGLKTVGEFKQLEVLVLLNSPITDAGIDHLTKLQNLIGLRLPYSQVTNKGLTEIALLSKLKELDLSGTQISDDGIEQLLKLRQLLNLNLMDTNLTNTGIERLGELKTLKVLNVSVEEGDERDVENRLQKLLPECVSTCWTRDPASGTFQATVE